MKTVRTIRISDDIKCIHISERTDIYSQPGIHKKYRFRKNQIVQNGSFVVEATCTILPIVTQYLNKLGLVTICTFSSVEILTTFFIQQQQQQLELRHLPRCKLILCVYSTLDHFCRPLIGRRAVLLIAQADPGKKARLG